MNAANFHLLLNHLPIIIPIIGLLILISGHVLKSEILKRTAYILFIGGAMFTFPTFNSGEGAEEVIEKLSIDTKTQIGIHKEMAERFALFMYVLGSLSIFGLWANWRKKLYADFIGYAVMAFALETLFFAKQTETTGGEIRHTEIRISNEINPNALDLEPEEEEEDKEN